METETQLDPFLDWLNQHIVKARAMDDHSFAKIAAVAQGSFPDLAIDSISIRSGLSEVARMKNYLEWPGSNTWNDE